MNDKKLKSIKETLDKKSNHEKKIAYMHLSEL